MNDPIVLVFIGLLIGFAMGLAVSSLRQSDDKEQEQSHPRTMLKDSVEVLSIWRSNTKSGRLRVILDGKPLSSSQITDEQKSRLTQVFVAIHKLVGEPMPSRSGPASAAQKPATNPSKAKTSRSEQDHTPAQPGPSPQKSRQAAPPPPVQTPTTSFADSLPEPVGIRDVFRPTLFKSRRPLTQSQPVEAPKSIVEQIDEILQNKLESSPLAGKDISLQELPGKGMMVTVGNQQYEGVGSVPDLEIRALIKAAATEWNNRVGRKPAS